MSLYQIAVRHPGLNAYRVISGSDWYTVNMKARMQYEQWEQEWRRLQAQQMRQRAEADARDRDRKRANRDRAHRRCMAWAAEQTAAADRAVEEIRTTLSRALAVHDALDWEALVDRSEFSRPRPEPERVAPPPDIPPPGEPPDPRHPHYQPDLGVFDRLSDSRRQARIDEAQQRLLTDQGRWAGAVERVRAERDAAQVRYEAERQRAERDHRARLEAWERDRAQFLAAQRERNEALADRRRRYRERDRDAVVAYCHMVLARSDYPDTYPRQVDVELDAAGTLAVDLTLPPLDCVPEIRAVTFNEETEQYTVTRFTADERASLHESLIHQIALRTAHELFEADRAGAIDRIAFSGWLRDGSAATRAVSFSVDRAAFAAADLAGVDPVSYARALGGEAPARSRRLVIQPAVSVYGGLGLDDASIEDFEHFVRELLERDEAEAGERVAIARVAGGVDALVIAAPPSRSVRLVAHARRGDGSCTTGALETLRDAVAYERSAAGLFITTCHAPAEARDAAEALGLRLIDAAQLMARLATAHARPTAPIPRQTADLDAEAGEPTP
jgi:restriction system protein